MRPMVMHEEPWVEIETNVDTLVNWQDKQMLKARLIAWLPKRELKQYVDADKKREVAR